MDLLGDKFSFGVYSGVGVLSAAKRDILGVPSSVYAQWQNIDPEGPRTEGALINKHGQIFTAIVFSF